MLALLPYGCEPVTTTTVVANDPTILAFHADWCKPCNRMKPVWADLEIKGYQVLYIDVDVSKEDEHYRVVVIPTTIG
jgi:thiol-disulfide isomerase/thioredoxin